MCGKEDKLENNFYVFKYNGCRFGKNVLFSKGELRILKNSLTLITGENGCGKSTLLKKILYNYHNAVVMVSQENDEVFSRLSVVENITMMQTDISQMLVKSELSKYGMQDILDKTPAKMSGGEKRILSILRGLLSNREIIILDEPTKDLDYRIFEKIKKIIEDYKKKKTIIVVTHDERLYDIAEEIYHFENKIINKIKNNSEGGKKIDIIESDKIVNEKPLINRIFRTDYFFMYFLILITVITCVFFGLIVNESNVKIERPNDMDIELCNTIYDNHNKLIKKGFLPTAILKSIDNGKNVDTVNLSGSGTYSFGLNVDSTDNYDVFNTLLFDIKTSSTYSVVDDIDNVDEYKKRYKEIKDMNPDAENIYLIVKLRGDYSFDDFVHDKRLEDLFEGDYYIRSEETIKIVETALKIQKMKKLFKNWCVIVGVLVLLIVYYIFLTIGTVKKQVNVILNYGFDEEKIIKSVIERNVNKRRVAGLIIMGEIALSVIFTLVNKVHIDYIVLIIPVCYTFATFFVSCVYCCGLRKCVKKLHKVEGEF